ncbi:hypothetical protein NESM_000054100 [Novymonas esmeraldas]|uniref:Uncharacterized protein n=1 Tax=Novymonas esmeraldas TaxID=1808958 RepID=A0AAW0F361_9TRYP
MVSRSSPRCGAAAVAARVATLTAVCALLVLTSAAAAFAAATPTSSAASERSRDRRVADLRAALLSSGSSGSSSSGTGAALGELPDPPLELGVHTACKKFGRGCPDTYVAFLEAALRERRGVPADAAPAPADDATADGGAVVLNGAVTDVVVAVVNVSEELPADTAGGVAESAVAAPAPTLPRDLRLPLQLSWSYEQRRRLENLLHLVASREAELRRDGVASPSLLRRYPVPSSEHLHLVEDIDGDMTARLEAACAAAAAAPTSWSTRLPGWTWQEWESLYGVWCRFMDEERRRPASIRAASGGAAVSTHVAVPLPHTPWPCIATRWATIALHMLVRADRLLAQAWRWSVCVAVPSSCVVCVLLWLCAGDAWTDAAETFAAQASCAARTVDTTADARQSDDNAAVAAPSPGSPSRVTGEVAPVAHAAHGEHAVLAMAEHSLQELQQRRVCLLRCRFAESALHRAPTLFFLKLRLLLCLLVAGQLLWSLWDVLATSHRLTTTVAPVVQYLLPPWLLPCLSAYLVAPLLMVVLGTALRGALGAHEELLVFQAQCAAEQRVLLTAAGAAAVA